MRKINCIKVKCVLNTGISYFSEHQISENSTNDQILPIRISIQECQKKYNSASQTIRQNAAVQKIK